MFASLGLGRLEDGLTSHTLQPSEVTGFLDRVVPDLHRSARGGMPSAAEELYRHQLGRGHDTSMTSAPSMRSRHSAMDSLHVGGAAV